MPLPTYLHGLIHGLDSWCHFLARSIKTTEMAENIWPFPLIRKSPAMSLSWISIWNPKCGKKKWHPTPLPYSSLLSFSSHSQLIRHYFALTTELGRTRLRKYVIPYKNTPHTRSRLVGKKREKTKTRLGSRRLAENQLCHAQPGWPFSLPISTVGMVKTLTAKSAWQCHHA